MNLKLKDRKSIFVTFFANILWVVLFYLLFEQNLDTICYSLFSAFLSSILATLLFVNPPKNKSISLGYLLLYMCLLYYELGAVKYVLSDGGYLGFVENMEIRILGDVIVFLSLLLAILFSKLHVENHDLTNEMTKSDIRRAFVLSVAFVVFVVVYVKYFMVVQYFAAEQDVSVGKQVQNLLISITEGMVLMYCVFAWRKSFYSKIPLVVALFALVYFSASCGSRSVIARSFVVVLFLMVALEKVPVKGLWLVYVVGPLGVLGMTYLAFLVSGRRELSVIAEDIAYRFNLSDMLITVLERGGWWHFDFGVIKDGFKMCVPSYFSIDKVAYAYKDFLVYCGLSEYTDYTDTIFSSSAIVVGIAGALLSAYILTTLFTKIHIWLNQISGRKGLFLVTCFAFLCVSPEEEFTFYIPAFRNFAFLLLMIIGVDFVMKYKFRNFGRKTSLACGSEGCK